MFENSLLWFSLISGAIALQALFSNYFDWFQRVIATASMLISLGSLFFINVNVPILRPVIVIVTLAVFTNGMRMASLRHKKKQRRSLLLSDAFWLHLSVTLVFAVCLFDQHLVKDVEKFDEFIMLLSFILASYAFVKSYWALSRARFIPALNDSNPSVSLLIPARNEDHALNGSLRYATKSSYKKLEILVLDDCSQDSTAEIIRSFAHDGVRFINGEEPDKDWVGKNQAYSRLFDESSGDYLLFCGVDIHLEPQTISELVSYMDAHQLEMVSVLPKRRHIDAASTLMQPLRYSFQLISNSKSKPAALSSCWMIRRSAMKDIGGFKGLRKSVIPEEVIAKKLVKNQTYRFILSNKHLGVSTRKRASSQIDTAIRTHFPLFDRRISFSAFGLIALLWTIVLPFLTLIGDNYPSSTYTLALMTALVLILMQTFVMVSIRPKSWWLGIFQLPIAALIEMYVIIESMRRYEFGKVEWKGRNVCIPVYDK